VEIGI